MITPPAPKGFKTISTAASDLGVSASLLKRRANEGAFKVYRNPMDRRQKLVNIEEINDWLERAGVELIDE